MRFTPALGLWAKARSVRLAALCFSRCHVPGAVLFGLRVSKRVPSCPFNRRRVVGGAAEESHFATAPALDRGRPSVGWASESPTALPFRVGGAMGGCHGAKWPLRKPSVAVLRARSCCNPNQRTDEMTGSEGEHEPQQVAPCQGHGDQDTGEQEDGFHGRAPPGYLREGEPAGLPASTTRQLSIPQTRPESARENRSAIEDRP